MAMHAWLRLCIAMLATLVAGVPLLAVISAGAAQPSPNAQGHCAMVATGIWVPAGAVPAGYDPAFAQALRGWMVVKGGSAAACHLTVSPGKTYLVAMGFFDPGTKPGARLQDIVLDGRKVDTLDPSGPRPIVRLYEAADRNGDGYLQVSCSHAKDELGATGLVNIMWLFDAKWKGQIDAEKLARGACPVPPLLRCDASTAERRPRGHVTYPPLVEEHRRRMLPLRPVALGQTPARPQPVDPLRLEIKETLRQTEAAGIHTVIITGDNRYTAHSIAHRITMIRLRRAIRDLLCFAIRTK